MQQGHSLFYSQSYRRGKPVPADTALQAMQTALCCVDNTFAHLSVERRKWILQHLNEQLVPMAEEDFPSDGTLFGPKFGKKDKERVDAIKNLASSSSVFFRLGNPPSKEELQGSRGSRKRPRSVQPIPQEGSGQQQMEQDWSTDHYCSQEVIKQQRLQSSQLNNPLSPYLYSLSPLQ